MKGLRGVFRRKRKTSAGPRPNRPSRQDRARRRQVRWRLLGRCLVAVALILAASWSAIVSSRFVEPYVIRALAITHVTVTGNVRVARQDVLDRLKLRPKDTLWSINTSVLSTRVESLPWVKRATVTRIVPHTLAVQIVERRPGALLHSSSRTMLLDEDGAPLAEGADDDDASLPLLVGLHPNRLLARNPDELEAAAKGVELGALLARTFSGRPEVDVANPDNVVAYVHGLRLQFGPAGFEEKWNLYRKMEPHLAGTLASRRGDVRSEIDLRYPGKVIVRERG